MTSWVSMGAVGGSLPTQCPDISCGCQAGLLQNFTVFGSGGQIAQGATLGSSWLTWATASLLRGWWDIMDNIEMKL